MKEICSSIRVHTSLVMAPYPFGQAFMVGLDIDLWTREVVEKVVSSFGLLMIWEEDHYNQARAVVKVRVSGLDEIP
jgi:hypothetical protein